MLSGQGAAYSRFLFALPFALLYLFSVLAVQGSSLPSINALFVTYSFIGSISQIIATVLLLHSFKHRSFAVGTTISKLEVVIVALFGVILLGDHLSPLAQVAIALSAIGLVTLTAGQNQLSLHSLISSLKERATLLGLGAAVFLGASVVMFRGASLSLNLDNPVLSAAVALAAALTIQTMAMGTYLILAEPGELGKVIRSWRWSVLVGIAGMLASVGWFTAFTLQNASYVRALGQIELLFTLLVTTRIFREKVSWQELLGCLLIITAIVMLLLSRP